MNSKQTPPASSNGSLSGVQRLMTSRWLAARNIVWIANLALVALLGYFVWGLVTHRDEVKPKPQTFVGQPVPKGTTANPAEPAATERDSGSRSLFAESAPTTAAASGGSSGEAPATQLQLKLLGTIPGEKSMALADIQDSQTKLENLYHIGDTIQGGQVQEIARGRVVLLVNGHREVLEMTVSSAAAESATGEAPKPITTSGGPSMRDTVKALSPRDIVINKHNLGTRIMGMEQLLKTVRLDPYIGPDGKTEGMKISGLTGEVAAMASLANLQNGDVIQNINGQNLTNQQKTFQVLRKAREQSSLSVQILRGDSVIPMTFSMTASDSDSN